MRPALHVIAWHGPGRLATMGHPRGGELLAGEMSGLARAGVDVFVWRSPGRRTAGSV
jgi:hypothetical protein